MPDKDTYGNTYQSSVRPASPCRTYTVNEITSILSISQTTAYHLIKQNLFHTVRVGRHIRISKPSFDAWLNGKGAGGLNDGSEGN